MPDHSLAAPLTGLHQGAHVAHEGTNGLDLAVDHVLADLGLKHGDRVEVLLVAVDVPRDLEALKVVGHVKALQVLDRPFDTVVERVRQQKVDCFLDRLALGAFVVPHVHAQIVSPAGQGHECLQVEDRVVPAGLALQLLGLPTVGEDLAVDAVFECRAGDLAGVVDAIEEEVDANDLDVVVGAVVVVALSLNLG